MTPELLASAGVVAGLGAAVVIVLVVPGLRRAAPGLLGLAVLGGGELIAIGLATGAADTLYLVDLAAAAAPIVVLLRAAASIAGAGPRVRWAVPTVWALVVLPVTTLGPPLATAGCAGLPCELQDFGGAVPLGIAPSAFVLLSVVVRRSARRPLPGLDPRAALLLGGTLWSAFVVWIVAVEGALDDYTPRLLLAGVVGPAVGAAVWLLVDRLRRAPRSIARSLALGAIAGIVSTLAGAATVVVPWSIAVAALASAIAAGVARRRTVSVARAGWIVLAAALVGLVAPVISGDAVGILFTAQIGAVPVPVLASGATGLFAAAVSLPVWLVIRARAGRLERLSRRRPG
jgi:hypothetical protein